MLAWIVDQACPSGWTGKIIGELPKINFGEWADTNGIRLEPLYNTKLHQRGAIIVDMEIIYLGRNKLSVLHPDELGKPEFTLEGWIATLNK